MSNSRQNHKSDTVQEKVPQTAKGDSEKKLQSRDETPSHTESRRRRMGKATAISQSSSSGPRESTATPSSARDTMSSSRHTPVDSIGQAEKRELSIIVDEHKVYQHNPESHPGVGQDRFAATAAPTLHAKRGDNDSPLPRRKSSKRKAEDQAREREVRAMSSPIPIPKRPMSSVESPLRRDTQKTPARLRKHAERHTSQISLPPLESFPDMGIISNQTSFKVNALDILSPRPTVRYSRNPRFSASRGRNLANNPTRSLVFEEDYSSKKRIDDLANSLDASALRELMERDQRRRERKRITDQARLEQKLKRAAEHDKELEFQETTENKAIKENEISGAPLRSPPTQATISDSARVGSADPFSDDDTIEPGLPLPPALRPGSSIYTRTSQASFSPPTSPTQRTADRASLSHTSGPAREGPLDIEDAAELSRRASEQSPAQLGSWTSFFRRGGNRGKPGSLDRGRHASGEFSNTSRDSVSRIQPQTAMAAAPRTFRKSDTPQRTQSKFREDLPELPLSPPDSRVQSPEVGTRSHVESARPGDSKPPGDSHTLLEGESGRAILKQEWKDDQLTQNPMSDPETPPPAAALSRSLASVDSEASWLSGRPVKRSSVQRDHPLRQSQSSLRPNLHDSDVGEEGDVADDPYFSRLSPGQVERRRSSPNSALRKASSTALNLEPDSSSEGEPHVLPMLETSNERWHSGVARHPTLIRQAAQARSKEGLLKEYHAKDVQSGIFNEEASDLDSPDAEETDLQASSSPILRAQSVNFGTGHVRHISAGSAKLLDIRRSSVDSKRQSFPRAERSSTPIQGLAPKEDE
jgi:hypothetical protein